MFRKIVALVLIISVLFTVCSCSESGPVTRIPEFEEIADMDAGYYYVDLRIYDGKKLTVISKNMWDKDSTIKLNKTVNSFLGCKGRKVNGWTTDKIKYPVYSLTISPRMVNDGYEGRGTTVVYTNGYLITSSGDVYKCNPDLKPFMKLDDNDTSRETELEDITHYKGFRPLAYTDSKWNADMLYESMFEDSSFAPGVEVETTGVREEDGYQVVRVLIKNNGSQKWSYDDRSIFIGVEVQLDGIWYHLYHDPSIDDQYTTFPYPNSVLQPGEDMPEDFYPGLYGKLPAGKYRLLIYGNSGDGYNYATAEFSVG